LGQAFIDSGSNAAQVSKMLGKDQKMVCHKVKRMSDKHKSMFAGGRGKAILQFFSGNVGGNQKIYLMWHPFPIHLSMNAALIGLKGKILQWNKLQYFGKGLLLQENRTEIL
jgi:hypothetical protein